MTYPTDSAENLAKAYLRPIPPHKNLPYVIIPCDVINDGPSSYLLPKFRFMAIFDSVPVEVHLRADIENDADASFLTIIWLQNELWPLVSDDNLRQISALDWPKLAQNGNW
jgi:hypothetical protein